MNIIKRTINGIPTDKRKHVILGLMCFPLVFFFEIWGGVVAILFLLSIEFYQKFTKTGRFEWWDWISGSIPVLFYMLMLFR